MVDAGAGHDYGLGSILDWMCAIALSIPDDPPMLRHISVSSSTKLFESELGISPAVFRTR